LTRDASVNMEIMKLLWKTVQDTIKPFQGKGNIMQACRAGHE